MSFPDYIADEVAEATVDEAAAWTYEESPSATAIASAVRAELSDMIAAVMSLPTAAANAAAAADAVKTNLAIDGLSFDEAMKMILSGTTGKTDVTDHGNGTYTITFKDSSGLGTVFDLLHNPITGTRS